MPRVLARLKPKGEIFKTSETSNGKRWSGYKFMIAEAIFGAPERQLVSVALPSPCSC